jgi:hypothetical protein
MYTYYEFSGFSFIRIPYIFIIVTELLKHFIMTKRTRNFVDKFSNEDDLQLYISQNNVSVKRTVETAAGKTITYQCCNYRKYPISS